MSPRARTLVTGLVTAAGGGVVLVALVSMRREDWPIYAVFTVLSLVLYFPYVQVLPNLTLPIPGLAAAIGFTYIGGLPIVALAGLTSMVVLRLRHAMPERWQAHMWLAARPSAVLGTAPDLAVFMLGLAARWWTVSALGWHGRPASHAEAIAVGEMGGYLVWWLLSLVPVGSYYQSLWWSPGWGLRAALTDIALIMIFTLTPFVFLIAYGFRVGGLGAASAWSLSTLGLHFMLQRLTERRIVVEEQNQQLAALNRELEHRERLSAIGKMSSVVSHQMLQQLGVIGIHADLIRNANPGEDPTAGFQAKTHAAAIEDALRGVNRVMTDLLVFSRDLRLNLYEHPLARVLEESIEECRPQAAARRVRLELECPAEPTATLDKLKVKQAIVNVTRNAIDASPVGSAVVLQGSVQDGWAEIAVSDRGPGVPEADREAIFTPFFTTKEHGTGLGLAIAREFTEAHGGRIAAERRDGAGATFVLRLPQRGPAPG